MKKPTNDTTKRRDAEARAVADQAAVVSIEALKLARLAGELAAGTKAA